MENNTRKYNYCSGIAGIINPKICNPYFEVDASFFNYGVWSGAECFIEMVYLALLDQGQTDKIEKYNYELHMVLPKHRKNLPLKYACLTDTSVGQEKTRNFPLDRAYRIINGLIDLVISWKRDIAGETPIAVLVNNFDYAQHLSRKFFIELARRASNEKIFIFFETKNQKDYPEVFSVDQSTNQLFKLIEEKSEKNDVENLKSVMSRLEDNWEEKIILLSRYYKKNNEHKERALVLARAVCHYNHFGYYHEAGSLVEEILPFFNSIVNDDQELRWNLIGNILQGLITTGRLEEVFKIVDTLATPFISKKSLLAKMHYLLGIIQLRYVETADTIEAEKHFSKSVQYINEGKEEISETEYYFLSVFINNGMAFLKLRQGKPEEAIKLCTDGYQVLSEKLGKTEHQLHRSVLLYNSAQVYVMLEDFEKAIDFYKKSISIDPYYSEYYNELGNIYQRLEEFDKANECYEKSLHYSAPYSEAYFNQGLNYFKSGDYEKSLIHLSKSEEIDPDQPEIFLIRGEIYDEMGDLNASIQEYTNALSLDPSCVNAYLNRAVLYFQKNEYQLTEIDLKKAISVDPENQEAIDNLVVLEERLQARAS